MALRQEWLGEKQQEVNLLTQKKGHLLHKKLQALTILLY
jgi:hypothetical protein